MVYIATLVFQLWTHAYMYSAGKPGDPNAPGAAAQLAQQRQLAVPPGEPLPPTEGGVFRIHSLPSLPSLPSWGGSSDDGSSSTSSSSSSSTASDDSLDAHTPKMLGRVAILLLVVVTVITGVTAEWLVSSIEGLVETGGVSESFVALILLPLVGNAAEHVTAVTVAAKDKLDLSIAVAVGSSIQSALPSPSALHLFAHCRADGFHCFPSRSLCHPCPDPSRLVHRAATDFRASLLRDSHCRLLLTITQYQTAPSISTSSKRSSCSCLWSP